jgi:hypothetical protein
MVETTVETTHDEGSTMAASAKEKVILRDLAKQVAQIASLPIQKERAKLWLDHNNLRATRPLVLAQPEGAWTELVPNSSLLCQDESLRGYERQLRESLFRGLHMPDDEPITGIVNVPWVREVSDYGVPVELHHGENRGSFRWDSPIKGPEDLKKLHFRTLQVDRAASQTQLELVQDLIGDLVKVERHGSFWWSAGMTEKLIMLRGLEQVMMDLYDNPQLLHQIMAFLRDETAHFMELVEADGLLTLNNGPAAYVGSGGIGHTDQLPATGFDGKVRLKDLWGLSESQEFVGVGPQQFQEFALQYQIPMASQFGLTCYGCCEGLDKKFDLILKSVPNLRRVSVSPWCNREVAADKLGDRYVYSWKPNPAMICAPAVDWDHVEKTTRETIRMARGCRLEMVMKDTHTVHNQPERFTRWCELARRLAEEAS